MEVEEEVEEVVEEEDVEDDSLNSLPGPEHSGVQCFSALDNALHF